MNTELMLDVGQANELKLAFRREGLWTNEKIKMLTEQKGLLGQVHEVLLGRAEIIPKKNVIDCDAVPFLPTGWQIEEHKKGGQFEWNPTKVSLWLAKGQQGGKWLIGRELRKELEDKPVLNVNVMDYLLKPENQHLIPEEWKGKAVFFWGTIYSDSDGYLYVRDLYWDGSRWYWHYRWLGGDWHDDYPAALAAS